ncbi:MAG: hypothetical protein ACOZNI_13000 [Myxococcota bacterium]
MDFPPAIKPPEGCMLNFVDHPDDAPRVCKGPRGCVCSSVKAALDGRGCAHLTAPRPGHPYGIDLKAAAERHEQREIDAFAHTLLNVNRGPIEAQAARVRDGLRADQVTSEIRREQHAYARAVELVQSVRREEWSPYHKRWKAAVRAAKSAADRLGELGVAVEPPFNPEWESAAAWRTIA